MEKALLFPTKITDNMFLENLWKFDFSQLKETLARQPKEEQDQYVSLSYALAVKTQLWCEGLDRMIVKELRKVLKNSFCKDKKSADHLEKTIK